MSTTTLDLINSANNWKAAVCVAAAAAAVLTGIVDGKAGPSGIRASCSENGRIVYREDIFAENVDEKRILISAQHPNALCTFIDLAPTGNPGEISLPVDLISAAAGGQSADDLSSALRAIGLMSPGQQYAPEMSFGPPRKKDARAKARHVDVAIGVYKGVPLESVLEHWRKVSAGTRVAARMTPTIAVTDDVTLLSIEGVLDEDVASLCKELEDKDLSCLSVF